jgi:hypothetical protein
VSPKDGISELLLDTVRQKTGVSQIAQQAPAEVLAAAGYKPRVCTPLSHMAAAVLGFDTTASAGELVDIVGAVVQVCLNHFCVLRTISLRIADVSITSLVDSL